MAGEFKAAGFTIHSEDGDVIASLFATIKIPASGIEVEATRIVSSCPFFPYEIQVAIWANRKKPMLS